MIEGRAIDNLIAEVEELDLVNTSIIREHLAVRKRLADVRRQLHALKASTATRSVPTDSPSR
jgi:hypothetical protein